MSFLTKFEDWGHGEPYALSGFFEAHGFKVKELGEVRQLTTTYKPRNEDFELPVNYFAYINSKNRTLTCFTDANREIRQKTIDRLTGEIGIYYLWISPTVFDQMKAEIITKHPGTRIPYFYADRHPSSRLPSVHRPEVERGFTYRGEDGQQTLEELRHYYGVLPRYVQFDIPGLVEFTVYHLGVFHYRKGLLEEMFSYSQKAAELVLNIRRILERSKLELVDIETARKMLQVQNIIPWEIRFNREIDVNDAESMLNELRLKGFAIYNDVVTPGSVYLDATVFDERKRSVFSVTSDKHRMIVSPRHNTTFDSFLRFFETITDSFDPEASIRAPA